MPITEKSDWGEKVVPVREVLKKIKPGMTIFLGTGVAEPRTLVKGLMKCEEGNLQDLEIIQLLSFGDAITVSGKYARKFRLKTFFEGWIAHEAITAGRVDLIPCRFSRIPQLLESGTINIDVAFVQITPPDENGYCSLGVAVDVARQAMEQASLVVGEINQRLPRTFGATFVHVDDFDFLVEATGPPSPFPASRSAKSTKNWEGMSPPSFPMGVASAFLWVRCLRGCSRTWPKSVTLGYIPRYLPMRQWIWSSVAPSTIAEKDTSAENH